MSLSCMGRSGVDLWSIGWMRGIIRNRFENINNGRCWLGKRRGWGEMTGMFSRPWWHLFFHRVAFNIHNLMFG